MEPKEEVADLLNDLPTTPLFSPLYHQSATIPEAEQNNKFFTTKLPQKKEINRKNRISGEICVVNPAILVHTPGVFNDSTPSAVVRAHAHLATDPAAAVAAVSRHSERRKEVPSMTTTSTPLLIATPKAASCHMRAQPISRKVRPPARKRMEG